MMVYKRIFGILLLLFICGIAKTQVWQWSVSVNGVVSSETHDQPRAFLWIPENCKQVKGVVVGQHNMLEEGILEHPLFRKTLSELGFAEVWVSPIFSLNFDFNKNAVEIFNEMMEGLSKESGYHELAFAPIVPIGHSALASYPWNFAAALPARTLAILSIHGDAPLTNLTGSGQPNPEWGDKDIDGIPGLMVEGEYEWWIDRVRPALNFRKQHPNAAISFLGDAGHGHFDYSDKLIAYLGLFLKKAAKYRLPRKMPLDEPIHLKKVDPMTGWLADRFRPDSLPRAKAAPFDKYRGNKRAAFWYFDKEMAKATENYYNGARGKKAQYISYMQADTILSFDSKLFARVIPSFKPLSDGITFHLKGVFTDSTHSKLSQNHAVGRVEVTRICGPVRKINDTTFAISFYRMGFNNPKRSGDIWFIAKNKGDKFYKSMVQQADMHIDIFNKGGALQKIDFPKIPDQHIPLKPLTLKATASSGMQVYYFVKEGPAIIKDGKLFFTKVPPRANFPVKVTVVAWQYGLKNKIQSAKPVEQSFFITND